MAKESTTIEEVKKARIVLEKQILDLAKAFEKKYKLRVSYINLDRKDGDKPVAKSRGQLVDVSVNMELDVLYN